MNNQASNPANLLGLDYTKEAAGFKKFEQPLIDVHTHLIGNESVRIYQRAAALYGIGLSYSMTPLEYLPIIKQIMGETVRFIAVPRFRGSDPIYDHGAGYIERLKGYYKQGARIAKFWTAPRIFALLDRPFASHPLKLNSPLRLQTIQAACDLGMILMVHVGDPDTWFKTKYADSARFGGKREQYDSLEDILSRFTVPVIAAHMGGWIEDLNFLSRLLESYPHLYLDSSATKWMVREISKHAGKDVQRFFSRWKTRILFGSDIVSSDSLEGQAAESRQMSEQLTFELYASRYWALRKLFESDYHGPSPIADPDLSLIEPGRYSELDAPDLHGQSLDQDLLERLYYKNAAELLDPLFMEKTKTEIP